MKIEELIPHKRNSEFFDDMTGEKWQEFLESIKTSGVIEPIVITQDKVIVSGHQRVRACKELGITEILAETKHYKSEDDVIKDLLETNIRQRGDVGGSDLKLGRRIRELERIYGVRNGSANPKGTEIGVSSSNGTSRGMTQQDLANQFGIDINTLKRAKSLTTLPSEIQDLIEQGNISPSTASRLIAKLTPKQQEELVKSLPITEKLTQKQVQGYISQINSIKSQVEETENLKEKIRVLQSSIQEIEQHKTEVQTITKEVIPDDYNVLKSDNKCLKTDNARISREYTAKCKELEELKSKLKAIEDVSAEEQFSKKLKDDTIFFCGRVADFLQKNGGYIWITEHINELPEYEKKSYISAIDNMSAWCQSLKDGIKI